MTARRRITGEARRRALVARQHVGRPFGGGIVELVDDLVALHATDPASVHLSVVARRPGTADHEVAEILYEKRDLVRMMGMRRTLFVVPRALAPVVQHSSADAVAVRIRRALVKELESVVPGADRWLADLEDAVVDRLVTHGDATATALVGHEPRLATRIGDPDDRYGAVAITSRVLTVLGTQGRIVRGRPGGGWTGSRYAWSAMSRWFPDGLPRLDPDQARVELLRRYLGRFGPVTLTDAAWWTGWTLTDTRRALAALSVEEVELDDGQIGLVLVDLASDVDGTEPGVALLPALDPTPMGWKERDWYLGPEQRAALFDRSGNIGPSVWCRGEIVGGWGQRADGAVVHRLFHDIGAAARTAVAAEAERLDDWLAGTRVTPKFRTPLERDLATS